MPTLLAAIIHDSVALAVLYLNNNTISRNIIVKYRPWRRKSRTRDETFNTETEGAASNLARGILLVQYLYLLKALITLRTERASSSAMETASLYEILGVSKDSKANEVRISLYFEHC